LIRVWRAASGQSRIDYDKRGRSYTEEEKETVKATLVAGGVSLDDPLGSPRELARVYETFPGYGGRAAAVECNCPKKHREPWLARKRDLLAQACCPAAELLHRYSMPEVGRFFLRNERFTIELYQPASGVMAEAIYAFVINDEIMRIGTAEESLNKRLKNWEQSVTGALRGGETQTPNCEAREWKRCLDAFGHGLIFARPADEVTTRVGTFRAMLDEERFLIDLFKPPMNRSRR
jgi:hypothetical protein